MIDVGEREDVPVGQKRGERPEHRPQVASAVPAQVDDPARGRLAACLLEPITRRRDVRFGIRGRHTLQRRNDDRGHTALRRDGRRRHRPRGVGARRVGHRRGIRTGQQAAVITAEGLRRLGEHRVQSSEVGGIGGFRQHPFAHLGACLIRAHDALVKPLEGELGVARRRGRHEKDPGALEPRLNDDEPSDHRGQRRDERHGDPQTAAGRSRRVCTHGSTLPPTTATRIRPERASPSLDRMISARRPSVAPGQPQMRSPVRLT